MTPKYVIERSIPNAGRLTAEQLQGISQTSCGALRSMRPEIPWLHSHVTGDKVYCVSIAPNSQAIEEHATRGGFPANLISEVVSVTAPTAVEGKGCAATLF